jgi:predicted metal-dependent peptidase
MKFSKIIGNIDKKLVEGAESKLSQIFLELGVRYDNNHVGTKMGGDPLIFGLLYPVEHVCTLNMPTAATDGKRYYWNPKFVLKQSGIGLRIICAHEAWHALYMHPQRRGSRIPHLWNIAVDYIVNGTVMDDFTARSMDPVFNFTKHLGKYMTLSQLSELYKNPFAKIKGFEDLDPYDSESSGNAVKLPAIDEDRDLTPEEQKELEKRAKKSRFFYADPSIPEDMRRPEKIYDMLYALLPKCPVCGRVGIYKKPKKKNKKGDSSTEQDECCTDGIDVFGMGSTLDDHMDTTENEEKLSKRITDAMYAAKQMAGHIPASLEDEIGKLTAPKISWRDIVRTRLLKARMGNGRNDWSRFQTRPMFSGLLNPKRKSYYAHFGCLLDTSGSMSKDDMAFGLSQLTSLDERSEGTIVPADAAIYWDKATKIKTANADEISKVKVVGRGGTQFAEFFSEYEKNIGKCDFLIIITDGYLMDTDIAEMKNPGIDTIWLLTAPSSFKPPFGRVFNLRD